MLAAAAAAAASGGPLPPPNAADTLRTLLSGNNRPREWTSQTGDTQQQPLGLPAAAPPPLKKRKIIHQVFKDPLVISNHQKIGHVPNGKGPIVYKEVTDPMDNETTYMLCGECESQKLFRNLTSLYKHRLKDCCEPVAEEPVEEEQTCISSMASEAKKFLSHLTTDQLMVEFKQIFSGQNPPPGMSKDGIVDLILKHAMGEDPSGDHCSLGESPVEIPADIPPLSLLDSAMMYMGLVWPKLHATMLAYPHISPLMLAVSVITDCDPVCCTPRCFDAETQTRERKSEIEKSTGIILVGKEAEFFDQYTQCDIPVNPVAKSVVKKVKREQPKPRRSNRLRKRE